MSVKTGEGEEPTTFQVHQSVLCSSSGFLEARSKPEWSSGTAVVNLSHISSEAFELYISWLYSSELVLRRITDGDPKSPIRKSSWKLLATAYMLADELIDANFQNSIADVMVAEGIKEQITLDAEVCDAFRYQGHLLTFNQIVQLIYDGTAQLEEPNARLLLRDIFRFQGEEFLDTHMAKLPDELVKDVAMSLVAPSVLGRTEYTVSTSMSPDTKSPASRCDMFTERFAE